MYNRYIRNEHGDYICVPVTEPTRRAPAPREPLPLKPPHPVEEQFEPSPLTPPVPPPVPPPPKTTFSHMPHPTPKSPPPPDASRFLGQLLEKLRLQDVDTGDLLLLLILFFLFQEKADDEALIALGLLLIL